MKNKLLHNWGLKLISALFALLLWGVVTYINDPVVPYRISNIPVKLVNTNLVTREGKVYEILDESDVISVVTITGKRSIIEPLTESDIIATADFANMTPQGTIPIQFTTQKYYNQIQGIKGSTDTVKVRIEEKRSTSLALKIVTGGEVSEGYIVGDATADQNLVRVSGPESIISRIDRAEAEVTVTGFTSDIDTDADIRLYDAEGVELDTDHVIMNIKSVHVGVEILQTKRVGLSFETVGTPANGYQLTGEITSSPDSVMIAAKPGVIADINEIKVDADALNVTGQSADVMVLVNLNNYLPSNVRLADPSFNGQVAVTVAVSPEVTKEIRLESGRISFKDLPGQFRWKIKDSEPAVVTVAGLSGQLRNLSAEDITAYLTMDELLRAAETDELEAGTYEVELTLELPTGIRQVSRARVTIEITEEE